MIFEYFYVFTDAKSPIICSLGPLFWNHRAHFLKFWYHGCVITLLFLPDIKNLKYHLKRNVRFLIG